MTLRHLKIFAAVCEFGGITKAAEALHIAQPSVSHTIAEMEKYYKVTLFDRVHQRLVLTGIGKELLFKAKEVLADFRDFETLASQENTDPVIRIGASLTIGQTVLPSLILRLRERIPTLQPMITIRKTVEIEKELECGNLDFAIVEGDSNSSHLQAIPFSSDHLIAVCQTDSPFPDAIEIRTLVQYPLLLREKGSAPRELLDQVLAAHRLYAVPMLESVSNQAIIAAAKNGLGIAILPSGLLAPYLRDKQLKQIQLKDVCLKRSSYLLAHKSKKFTSLQREAYDLFLQASAENLPLLP